MFGNIYLYLSVLLHLICIVFMISACRELSAVEVNPAPNLLEVFINDKPVFVEPGTTILQVLFYDCHF